MANDNQNITTWINQYIDKISKKSRKTTIEKNIIDLTKIENKTPIQERIYKRLLDNEYKKYLTEKDIQEKLSKLNSKSQDILKSLTKKSTSKLTRKKREHDLIVIGSLTDLVKFPKDKGIVAGAFSYILEQVKNKPEFLEELKKRGDKILFDRELEKKKAKEQKKESNNNE